MNQVRIIGGRWRGRKIDFPDAEGLRPTPDRLRETLFNWLAPRILNARCLDLFAGSGALGWEALSRGASEVVFVEQSPPVCRALKKTATTLQAEHAVVIQEDALAYLARQKEIFDIIFLDPPFHSGLFLKTMATLMKHPCWTPETLIYCEVERELIWPTLPDNWAIWREKSTKEIQSRVLIQNSG